MSAASLNAAIEGPDGRTKYRALALHIGTKLGSIKTALDKKEAMEPLEAARVELAAAILKDSREKRSALPATTKPDVRFPNTNQAANCWCAFFLLLPLFFFRRARQSRLPHAFFFFFMCATPASPTPRVSRQSVNEYQMCVKELGDSNPRCLQRARDYNTVCPKDWIATWKGHVEAGNHMTVGTQFYGAGED